MSGHSKWSTIKHKKATTDARRGKLFSKLLKEVTVAARMGGADAKGNPRLRSALLEARSNSVPLDNIERAIKKGTGEVDGEAYEEVTYEGYGPGGVAILLEVATDNRNRTAQDVRHLFARHGGNLGESGSVGWIFRRRGYFAIERGGTRTMSEEEFMDLALELGVDDIAVEEDRYEMYSAPEDFTTIHEALESRNVQLAAKELAMVPQTTIDVPADRIGQVLRLMEALEDHDDVQKAWANFNVDERVMSAMADR